jgi:bifunctional DNA-binding transcriptional regulator/antitoxin component of YhaV-PrlF toxin-antitoxin module
MKLQKQISRKVGKQEYSKYAIVLPSKDVEKLGWKQGQELEFIVEGNEARIKAKKS